MTHSVLFFRAMQVSACIVWSHLPVPENHLKGNIAVSSCQDGNMERSNGDLEDTQFCQVMQIHLNKIMETHNGKEHGALENDKLGPTP